MTGANGQLGSELQASCPENVTLIATDCDTLDLVDANSIRTALANYHPDVVINAAAYTAVDKAEIDVERAYAVNHLAVLQLAQAITSINESCLKPVYLLHISTDFVFDGSKSCPYQATDTTKPLGVYGASKLAGEQAIQQYCPSAAIVRTSWLYSVYGHNFVKTILRLLNERDSLSVVADQIGAPTWTKTLAETLWTLAIKQPSGIFHCSDNGVASWYDFAVAIQEEAFALGLIKNMIPIKPLPSEGYPTPAQRPSFSVLDKRDTEILLDSTLPHWRTSLRSMLTELKQKSTTS